MRTVTMLGSGVLAVAGVGLVAPPAMAATVITCGATVTGDVYLAHDLRCADGINVTGDATLDLRGHRFSGPGRPTPADGITVSGVGDVRIVNGRLSGWGEAVAPGEPDYDEDESAASLLVDRVTFADNSTGVETQSPRIFEPGYARQVSVQRSRFAGNGTGVTAWSARIDVQTSTFADNGTAANAGSSRLQIRNSVLVRNGTAADCDESACELENDVLRDNTIGIDGTFGSHTGLTDSSISGNTVGVRNSNIYHFGGSGDLSGNRFSDNESAVEINSGGNATLTGNSFTRNDSAVTSDVTDLDDDASATLTGNTFTRNGDAINLLIPVKLKQNSAVRNTGWGIYAPNATDLGGNTAHGNGKSPQCTGVVCS